MYVYFNKEGRITTKIPHGEIVRQGNPLNLYVCIEPNSFINNENFTDWSASVRFVYPDGKTSSGEFPSSVDAGPERKKFIKLKDSEITYDLVPGRWYYTFIFNIDAQYSTNIAGNLIATLRLWDTKHNEMYYQENINIFVEAVKGYNVGSTNITANDAQILKNNFEQISYKLQRINSKINILGVSVLPPIVTDFQSENFNLDKIYVLNGNFEDIQEIPDFYSVIPNYAYKYGDKYYKLIKPENEDGKIIQEEIVDFEKTIGYIYKPTENGWVVINRDIREVIGLDTDTIDDETIKGLKNHIVKNVLHKTNEENVIYATDSDGNQIVVPYSQASNKGATIVQRSDSGHINAPYPTDPSHAPNKDYVDKELAKKIDKIKNANIVYATDENGNQIAINYSKPPLGTTLAQRNDDGQLDVALPTENQHATNKKYVDDKLKNNTEIYEFSTDFPAVGEVGKFYISTFDEIMHYWNGKEYKEISSSGSDDFDVIDGGDAEEYDVTYDILDGGGA